MKRIFIFSVILLFISCSQDKNLSPAETSKMVLKSFYEKDNSAMKKFTTVDGDIAWVKYNTSYDEKLGVFKLFKENGQWKVSRKEPRERVPF